jgi:hypothetical protein
MSNSKIQVANEFQSSTFKIIFDITTVPTLDKASDAAQDAYARFGAVSREVEDRA